MKYRSFIFLLFFVLTISFDCVAQNKYENPSLDKEKNALLYSETANGIHIIKGAWRPLFGSENVVWVKPSWPGNEYFWLDFPEAIWMKGQLFYLGHVSERFPSYYSNHLDDIKWKESKGSVSYERILSNGVRFGGSVIKRNENEIALEIWIENGTKDTLEEVFLQTCSFLYPMKEFNQMTNDNKVIHVPDRGWVTLTEAITDGKNYKEQGKYHTGWLSGPKIVDLPYIIATSRDGRRHIAFGWFDNTYSFIGNENHPCFHADPFFPDLSPGERKTIQGEIIFFEGGLTEFEDFLLSK